MPGGIPLITISKCIHPQPALCAGCTARTHCASVRATRTGNRVMQHPAELGRAGRESNMPAAEYWLSTLDAVEILARVPSPAFTPFRYLQPSGLVQKAVNRTGKLEPAALIADTSSRETSGGALIRRLSQESPNSQVRAFRLDEQAIMTYRSLWCACARPTLPELARVSSQSQHRPLPYGAGLSSMGWTLCWRRCRIPVAIHSVGSGRLCGWMWRLLRPPPAE